MLRKLALLAFLIAPGAALAHTGHGDVSGFVDGIAHPFGGADHLLAMVAVGLWAGIAGGAARLAYPAAFVGGLLLGGALGLGGIALPAMEPAILASVVVLGALAALALRLPLWAAGIGLAAFGLFHGNAHGLEATSGGIAYVAGFTLATLALHGVGLAGGLGATRVQAQAVARGAGALAAVGGLALAFG